MVANDGYGKSLGSEIIRRAESDGSGYIHREGLEIGAEKHIETYDVKVPAIIDKVVNPWGQKAKQGEVFQMEVTQKAGEQWAAGLRDDLARRWNPTPTTYIDLTPEMQKGVLYSPQALFMPAENVGKSVIHKNGHGYALMETARGNWRMYAPGGILVGVSATREAARLLYERHMLKEMRRDRK